MEQMGESGIRANEGWMRPADIAVEEGSEYSMRIGAKDVRGEGIGKIGNFVVFVKNAKTRIGNIYKVKVTRVYRTFAYATLTDTKRGSIIGAGSILEL
ncbi:MAG: TRAM domain-containing protein [Candidatus Marsarchaeota archaeon]|nr:TRAM domain-containing protein [Candidatus Marsarchaeota archaeon]